MFSVLGFLETEFRGEEVDLDLDKDLPVTEEDIEFLRKIRYHDDLTMEEYIDFLEEFWTADTDPGKRKFYDAMFEL